MPTSTPSIPSGFVITAVLATGLATVLWCPVPSFAQAAGDPASSGGARQSVADHGHAAMEKLEGAIARSKDEAGRLPDPVPAQTTDPTARARAFEGLRTRSAFPEMEVRARRAQAQGAAGLAAERERQAKALRVALGLEPSEEHALAAADPALLETRRVPLLFVSSSMPLAMLRTYAAQLERVQGVMALRGVPGGLGKMAPMAKLAAEILRLDEGCEGPACVMRNVQLVVDPIVFRQHGIARVPALAMIPGNPTRSYCERDDESLRAAYIVYGDSALSGLFEEYARLGGKEEVRDAQALLGHR